MIKKVFFCHLSTKKRLMVDLSKNNHKTSPNEGQFFALRNIWDEIRVFFSFSKWLKFRMFHFIDTFPCPIMACFVLLEAPFRP